MGMESCGMFRSFSSARNWQETRIGLVVKLLCVAERDLSSRGTPIRVPLVFGHQQWFVSRVCLRRPCVCLMVGMESIGEGFSKSGHIMIVAAGHCLILLVSPLLWLQNGR